MASTNVEIRAGGDVSDIATLHEQVGRGAFGVVHRATDCASGQEIAVKIVDRSQTKFSLLNFPASFVHLCLVHSNPHVLHYHRFVETPRHSFIITDYLYGGDLHTYFCEEAPVPEPRMRFYTTQMWSALKFIHEVGGIHRDIKPENFIFKDQSKASVVLVDLGSAVSQDVALAGAAQFQGTVGYAAPETLKEGGYNHKVDVFSLGAIVFLGLTCHFLVPGPRRDCEVEQARVSSEASSLQRTAARSGAVGVLGQLAQDSVPQSSEGNSTVDGDEDEPVWRMIEYKETLDAMTQDRLIRRIKHRCAHAPRLALEFLGNSTTLNPQLRLSTTGPTPAWLQGQDEEEGYDMESMFQATSRMSIASNGERTHRNLLRKREGAQFNSKANLEEHSRLSKVASNPETNSLLRADDRFSFSTLSSTPGADAEDPAGDAELDHWRMFG